MHAADGADRARERDRDDLRQRAGLDADLPRRASDQRALERDVRVEQLEVPDVDGVGLGREVAGRVDGRVAHGRGADREHAVGGPHRRGRGVWVGDQERDCDCAVAVVDRGHGRSRDERAVGRARVGGERDVVRRHSRKHRDDAVEVGPREVDDERRESTATVGHRCDLGIEAIDDRKLHEIARAAQRVRVEHGEHEVHEVGREVRTTLGLVDAHRVAQRARGVVDLLDDFHTERSALDRIDRIKAQVARIEAHRELKTHEHALRGAR